MSQAAGWGRPHGPLPPAPFLWTYREAYARTGAEATHTRARRLCELQKSVQQAWVKARQLVRSHYFVYKSHGVRILPVPRLGLRDAKGSLRLVLGMLPYTSQGCCHTSHRDTVIHAAGVLCNTRHRHPVSHTRHRDAAFGSFLCLGFVLGMMI